MRFAFPWRAGTACLLLFVSLSAAPYARAAPRVEREIPYAFPVGDPALRRRQSFDLYLPEKVETRPPLVIFIHGGFWIESDDTYGIGPRLAEVLAGEGAAVALVRYRLSPAVKHPTHVRDVAAALAALMRLAERYGYDSKRLYVIGHSAGATIAAQLALDPRYLREVGMKPSDLSGVVLLSGVYDLGPKSLNPRYERFAHAAFGADPAARKAASPITHAGKTSPMLVLVGGNDLPGFAADARRFVNRLRERGNRTVETLIVPGADSFGIANLRDDRLAHALIDDFVGLRRAEPQIAEALRLRQRWYSPPYSTEPFWHSGVSVRSFPVDRRLRTALIDIFGRDAYEFTAYPLERYYAIDLLAYLDAQPVKRVGRGDYLTITNVRGEKVYYRRTTIAPYHPVLVVGLDDEHNLFRIVLMYHNKLEYSWRKEVPPIMARPLGAFLYFQKEPPAELRPTTLAISGLTAEGFHLSPADPLAPLADLPQTVRDVLERQNTCLACHSFRGVGARSGHVTAAEGKLHGGFALALEEYSPAVWRQFIFDQTKSANLIGVNPNRVKDPAAAQALFDAVVAERSRTQ